MKNLAVIGLIWAGCAIAWVILGSTVVVRSGDTSSALTEEVHLLWGPPHTQSPPRAIWRSTEKRRQRVTSYTPQGVPVESDVEREETLEHALPLVKSDVAVKLALEHRRKGLLWFPTYAVDFRGAYAVENDSGARRAVEIVFPLAAQNAVYDGFRVTRPDGSAAAARVENGRAVITDELAAGERRELVVAYRSRGTSAWRYELTAGAGQVRDFRMVMDTDFAEVDFPAGTLSPTRHRTDGESWRGEWRFETLVANAPIGVTLPARLNPGPLAARITFFAPVGLLFFFFVIANFATVRKVRLHPLNYFFFGAAFFAFHLLFSYLVDHLAILPAFAVAAAASIGLVVTYARLFVGWRFALREMGIAQLVYLVLFSFTFFWQGFTGLAITVGAVLTLAVMMQVTGRAQRAATERTDAAA
jgi:hypothetical protein